MLWYLETQPATRTEITKTHKKKREHFYQYTRAHLTFINDICGALNALNLSERIERDVLRHIPWLTNTHALEISLETAASPFGQGNAQLRLQVAISSDAPVQGLRGKILET